MATGPDRRASERGLSLMEALVMIAVMALVSSIVFVAVQRDARRNYGRADHAIVAAGHARAEADFRRLIASAVIAPGISGQGPVLVEGSARGVRLETRAAAPVLCGAGLDAQPLEFSVVNDASGGALRCATSAGATDLVRWTNGDAVFSYSVDGLTWRSAWPEAASFGVDGPAPPQSMIAPLVRVSIAADGQRLVWIERAGRMAPAGLGEGAGAAP